MDLSTNFVVVSAFTPNYSEVVKSLRNSLDNFNIEGIIISYKSRGNWLDNVSYKPTAVLTALTQQPKNVVWIDADSEIISYPHLFNTIQEDIGFCVMDIPAPTIFDFNYRKVINNTDRKFTPAGGTIFFQNNLRIKKVVGRWEEIAAEFAGQTNDEQMLRKTLEEHPETSIYFLNRQHLGYGGENMVIKSSNFGYKGGFKPKRGL